MSELTPEERAKIYAEEKARLEARQELEAQLKQAEKSDWKKPSPGAKGCLWLIAIIVGLAIISNIFGSKSELQTPTPPPSISAADKKALATLAKREKKHGKRPEPSGWDGSIKEVKKYIEAIAKDPDSVKYEGWSALSYNDESGWLVQVDWRAKNSFGGYVRNINWFSISNGRITKHEANTFK